MLAKVGNDGETGLNAGNPINFKSVKLNEGMQYNNGVFLILQPGYYQVIVNLGDAPPDYISIEADIMVNNIHGNGFGRGGSVNMASIVKLDLYDSVNVRIRKGTTGKYADQNNFQIQKININNY